MLLNLGVLKTKYNHFKRREIRVFIINNVIIIRASSGRTRERSL